MKRILTFFTLLLTFICSYAGVTINHIDYSLNSSDYTAICQGSHDPECLVGGILTIPQYVFYNQKNYEVVEIAGGAFSNREVSPYIEWINFPDGLRVIGESAFRNCYNLWSMSSFTPALMEIKEYAFAGCKKLQDFEMPAFLRKLGGHALEGCTDLGIIIFNGNLEEISYAVCQNCTSLRVVVIFSGTLGRMKKIQDNAFLGCTELNLVFLPNSLEYIGEAFHGCNLTHITTSMYNPPTIGYNVFENPEKIRLEIPKGTANTYRNTYCWDRFFNIVETEENWETGVKLPEIDFTKNSKAYSINGQRFNENQKGIKIIRDAKGNTKKVMMQ